MVVQRTGIDIDVGVRFANAPDAFGRGDENEQLDALAAAILHLRDGCLGGAAGGKHRVNDHNVTLGNILGGLAEVDMGLKRFFIAVHTDMGDTRGGDHTQHAVNKTETGAQNGNDGHFFAGKRGSVHAADRRFDVLGGQRQIARGLVGDQHTDLRDKLTEILDAGGLVTHDRQLVGDEGMVHNVHFLVSFKHDDVLRYKINSDDNKLFVFLIQPLGTQPLCLRGTEIDGGELLGGDPFTLLRRQRDADGILVQKRRGGKLAENAVLHQIVTAQPSAVTKDDLAAGVILQLPAQLVQPDGTILTQTGEGAVLRFKKRVVDLITPGVHRADDKPLHVRDAARHCLKRRYPAARLVRRPGKPLHRGDADAKTGKRAGTVGNGDQVHIVKRQLGVFEHILHHRHEGAAVRQSRALVSGGKRRSVFRHGAGNAFG